MPLQPVSILVEVLIGIFQNKKERKKRRRGTWAHSLFCGPTVIVAMAVVNKHGTHFTDFRQRMQQRNLTVVGMYEALESLHVNITVSCEGEHDHRVEKVCVRTIKKSQSEILIWMKSSSKTRTTIKSGMPPSPSDLKMLLLASLRLRSKP
jgi:hypothetical protein